MPRTNRRHLDLVAQVAAAQRGLITAAQLVEIGYASNSIRHRARQGGPWRRVLPAVYLVSGGSIDADIRRAAALLYAGSPAALTGVSALVVRGALDRSSSAPEPAVHVLLPHHRRRTSHGFAHVERTVHWPESELVDGFPVVPVARAAIDGCRRMSSRNGVRALLAGLVQSGICTIASLERELAASQNRRSALARSTLVDLRAGPRSAPELEMRELWLASGLPPAVWNVDLYLPDGRFLARPDAYVQHLGIAVEVDSRAHHFEVDDWERTMRRHSRMTAAGLLVLHVTPHRIATDWLAIAREVRSAVDARTGQPSPAVRIGEAALEKGA